MTSHRLLAVAAALLVALTLAAYSPLTANHSFVFDDDGYILENAHVQQGVTAQGFLWAFGSFETANWHPLTWLSHMIDVEIFGLDARSHHMVNLLLHLLNTLLLFLGLRALTGVLWPSFAAAALFAVHPLHVESVAWISERKDLLCTLFGFLAVAAWISWVRRRQRRHYALMLICFLLSLLSKPMLVTLPFVLLLADWWPLGRLGCSPAGQVASTSGSGGRLRARLVEKLPLLLLAVASSAIAVIAQSRGASLQSLEAFPLGDRCANALLAYATYLRKAFWPFDLAAFYPYPAGGVSPWAAAGAALALAGVTVTVAPARRAPYLLAGWLFFLVTLVPVIGLVQIGEQSLADRYTYVPLVGVFVILAWSLPRLVMAWGGRPRNTAAMAAAALLGLAGATANQVGYWRDAGTLWTHSLEVTRGNWLAHNNLGVWNFKRGYTAGAIDEFSLALDIRPRYAEALYNLAFALTGAGKFDEAEHRARAATAVAPRWIPPRTLLGTVLFRQGRWGDAMAEYLLALRLDPARAETHRLLANALYFRGKAEEAEFHFRESLRLNPREADTHNELGVLLAEGGRFPEAAEEFRRALAWQRDYPQAHYNLGKALDMLGDVAGAVPHYREALRLDPSFADAHNNLAVDLLLSGDRAGAALHLRDALRIKPDFAAARQNLERALSAESDRR